eukprot:s1329_g3.t1
MLETKVEMEVSSCKASVSLMAASDSAAIWKFPRAIQTLQEAVSQSNTSPTRKSLAGAARVYLALALDAHELGDNQLRAEQLVREGLPMHRNLEHVWRAQERLLPQQQPGTYNSPKHFLRS